MTSILSSYLRNFPKTLSALPRILSSSVPSTNIEQTRDASKKAGGSSRNKRNRTKKKYRGLKQIDGAFVHKGELLATQFGLSFYPGENVMIMENSCNLVAAYDGIVVISTEKLNPYPDSPLYTPVQNGAEILKKFIHIIPTPLHGKFRLISQT